MSISAVGRPTALTTEPMTLIQLRLNKPLTSLGQLSPSIDSNDRRLRADWPDFCENFIQVRESGAGYIGRLKGAIAVSRNGSAQTDEGANGLVSCGLPRRAGTLSRLLETRMNNDAALEDQQHIEIIQGTGQSQPGRGARLPAHCRKPIAECRRFQVGPQLWRNLVVMARYFPTNAQSASKSMITELTRQTPPIGSASSGVCTDALARFAAAIAVCSASSISASSLGNILGDRPMRGRPVKRVDRKLRPAGKSRERKPRSLTSAADSRQC